MQLYEFGTTQSTSTRKIHRLPQRVNYQLADESPRAYTKEVKKMVDFRLLAFIFLAAGVVAVPVASKLKFGSVLESEVGLSYD